MRLGRMSGFSLLELILSAVIASLGVAGFFAALNASRKPVSSNDIEFKAAQIGKEYLENLRSKIAADTYVLSGGADPLSTGSHTDNVGIYKISYDVSLSVPSDPYSPKRVSMKVTWK